MSLAVLRQPQAEAPASAEPSAALWRHLLDLLPSGVVVIDRQGRVVEANPLAVALLGEPLVGERWLAVINRAFRPRADDGHEISLHDGRRVKIETRPLSPFPGQLVVLTDLTETRVLQSQIAHLERLSALGKMVATLAHQVRTPLSSATLYAAHLANDNLSSDARQKFAGKLQARLSDLEHQVNDMLLFARAGTNGAAESFAISELFDQVADSCAGVVALNKAALDIEPLPQVDYVGHQRALAGALMNLVHNSIDAGGSGVVIRLSARVVENELILRVADNGPGIPDALRERIFEPFFTTRSQGTGLGLAVVQAVVRQHQGRIRFEPNDGDGSCIALCLPLVTKASGEAP